MDQVGQSCKRYGEFINDGLSQGYSTPWDEVSGQAVLGKEEFVERLKGEITHGGAPREQPSVGVLGAKEPKIIGTVARQFKIKGLWFASLPVVRNGNTGDLERLRSDGNSSDASKLTSETLKQVSDLGRLRFG